MGGLLLLGGTERTSRAVTAEASEGHRAKQYPVGVSCLTLNIPPPGIYSNSGEYEVISDNVSPR